MPACQVGNLEYALSLDPSNTLLQKRLSEAKVGCLKVMDFLGSFLSWVVVGDVLFGKKIKDFVFEELHD